ncbi:MAG TPA: isocitrate/isopropylmalate dehydrogenase family protein [Levilinea sp.]|nr:isocitrate/isopropylmalate dehydrogenase family protein [Levilinea sp.]
MKTYTIALLPGDGIGPEVIEQARLLLEALPVQLKFQTGAIGFGAYQATGTPLPEESLRMVRQADAALFGAVTTPPNLEGYFSPILRLRQSLDLYANIRPCRSFPHPSSRAGIDLIIVRENTEDLYCGRERLEDGGNTAISERVITRRASQRILQRAFLLAQSRTRKQVTLVHKANVLRQTCGLFRQTALEVATCYPDVSMREMLVDTCAMELIRAPQQFDVIVTTNLFGDILSDEAAMLVGGLGVACSGNLGEQAALFEPVHGSAPALVGTGKANPVAAFLSAAMLLDYLGEHEPAEQVRAGVERLMRANQVTPDLGGSLSTEQVTQALVRGLA